MFADNDWPDVWTAPAIAEKKLKYPWLTAKNGRLGCLYCTEVPIPSMEKSTGIYARDGWMANQVGFNHGDPRDKKTKLTMLRNKVRVHLNSESHKASGELYRRKQGKSVTQKMLCSQNVKYQSSTEKVFRIAYSIAKMDQPYTDFPEHIDCNKANGMDLGALLHTDKTCAAIIDSISADRRIGLVKSIVSK